MASSEDQIIREITESAAEGRGTDIDAPNSIREEQAVDTVSVNKIKRNLSSKKLVAVQDTMKLDRCTTGPYSPNSLCGPGKEPDPDTKNETNPKKEPESCAPKRKKTDQKTSCASKAKKPKKSCSSCVGCGKRRNSSKKVCKKSDSPKKRQKKSDVTAKCPAKKSKQR